MRDGLPERERADTPVNGARGRQAATRGLCHPAGARFRAAPGRLPARGGRVAQQDGGVGGGFRLRPELLRAVTVGGGLHRRHERDQQREDDHGAAAGSARSGLQRPRRRPPSGTGTALQAAGARGAGGLLERVGRRTDAVTDQSRGMLGSHRQEIAEGGDITGTVSLSGAAQERACMQLGRREVLTPDDPP
ncbi:hypothetical protein [Streptomyces erythrochromogenes]|uniref:hypothetical protein n=1 Tax=Streptomyces erythrochromogenes TaxID=285574 RepID=UPI00386C4BE7|nr:hypothetical protein OG489_00395 [Streptomyces erythrochromogenes]WSR88289.1 hypothetical protein OG489_39565 [Streptomyces erythrochromogenes]